MNKLEQLAGALAHARAAAKKLDVLDDELSELIPQYEEALKGLRLGVRIAVLIGVQDGARYLAFDKYGGAWKLLIEEGHDDDPESWTETPLASASRDERASVFEHHLDRLLESAATQIEEKTMSRIATLKLSKERLAAIKALSGAKP